MLLILLAFACSTAPSPPALQPAVPPPAPATPTAHADLTTIKPGSHEDWCVEHAVPESQCSRCNSSLIPAFKATGDWCEEHALPESQCLVCNPEIKIVRPPPTGP